MPVSLHRANKKSLGYLFFNFGGPWANDVMILPSISKSRLTKVMLDNYDVLVMDPRGVAPNTIECKTDKPDELAKINQSLQKIFASGNENDANKIYQLIRQKQGLCKYSKLYQHASTLNDVKDIELLRKTLGINKLNFYVDSYGTRLGLAYIARYPEYTDKVILDGNLPASNQFASLIDSRAQGAKTTWDAFFKFCAEAGKDCILNTLNQNEEILDTSSLKQHFKHLLEYTKQNHGLSTSSVYMNRQITTGMIQNIAYSEMQPSSWKELALALYEGEKSKTGDALMKLYIANTGYNPKNDTYKTNNDAIKTSVICADYRRPNFNNEDVWLHFIDKIKKKYSRVGVVSTLWLSPICIGSHIASQPLLPKIGETKVTPSQQSPEVLIIGNKYDPMTPLENSISVKQYLSKLGISSSVIQWNAVSHTAMITDSPLSKCVFKNVDKFLLKKSLPSIIECHDWKNPFVSKM